MRSTDIEDIATLHIVEHAIFIGIVPGEEFAIQQAGFARQIGTVLVSRSGAAEQGIEHRLHVQILPKLSDGSRGGQRSFKKRSTDRGVNHFIA